ncbi:MAG: ketopantoate reductase family protein [Acidobacteriaceae bacterium]|nr:ketopantoate reductase family protein [Acidobacteriaceae bacterium]
MSGPAWQFTVIGAGSLGCVYGGNLARIGQRVGFVDVWQEHVDKIRSEGLRIEGLTGNFTALCDATTDPREAPKADVALVCVNAYSTEQATQTARMLLKPEGFCLTLQNGAGNVEKLTAALGTDRVLAGLSFQSGDLLGPGHARHTNNGPTYMGELDRSETPRLKRLAELFEQGGLNPVLVPDVVSTIWEKFVHNCGINAIAALTNLRPGHFQEVPAVGEFQTGIIEETVAMLRAKGVSIPHRDYVRDIKEYCAHKFHRVSMMQHLLRGQRTEIDALNGYVAAESERLGLSAPYNTALTQLMRGREHKPTGDPDQQHAAEQAVRKGAK